jgi:hypothetical protein
LRGTPSRFIEAIRFPAVGIMQFARCIAQK